MGGTSSKQQLSAEDQRKLKINSPSSITAIDIEKENFTENQGIAFFARYKNLPNFYFWSCSVAAVPGSSDDSNNSNKAEKPSKPWFFSTEKNISDNTSVNNNEEDDDNNTNNSNSSKAVAIIKPPAIVLSENKDDVFLKCKIGVDDGRNEDEVPYSVSLWLKQDLKEGTYEVKPATKEEFSRKCLGHERIPEVLKKRWFGEMETTQNQVEIMMAKQKKRIEKAILKEQQKEQQQQKQKQPKQGLQQHTADHRPTPSGIAKQNKSREEAEQKLLTPQQQREAAAAAAATKQVSRRHQVPFGLLENGFMIGPSKEVMKILEDSPVLIKAEGGDGDGEDEKQTLKQQSAVTKKNHFWSHDVFDDFMMYDWIVHEMNLQRNSYSSLDPLERLRQHLNEED